MKKNISFLCPVCNEKMNSVGYICPHCRTHIPIEQSLSPFDYLTDENNLFLKTFLLCRGNMKELEKKLHISYPTAKKRLEELLEALELFSNKEENTNMRIFKIQNENSTKASDIIRNKLYKSNGVATVYSARGNAYVVCAGDDGKTFQCKALPISPAYEYTVFDTIVDLLLANGGKARKGNGRNDRLGYGDCTLDTVVGAIGKNYSEKNIGESVFDPVFVLAAIMEWADIAHNKRGYLELTANYQSKISEK